MATVAMSVLSGAAASEIWGHGRDQELVASCPLPVRALVMCSWPLPLLRILRTSLEQQQLRMRAMWRSEAESAGVPRLGRGLRWPRLQHQRVEEDWKKDVRESLLRQGSLGLALLSTSAVAKSHISPFIFALRANPIFMSGLVAWALAQILKVFTAYFVERKWDLKMLLGSGGMPSSHSALCIGLSTSVAICHGVSDALFPVCLGFSLIVMYDAAGVRRHAGMQAEVLNMIVEDLFQGHPVSERKLKELLGHTPLQVAAGACLGMLVGYACSQSYLAVC
eukprot:TRINITY_DN16578_c0_g1_i1.p1 TRINITY_DN16578_c0_g1~~TRINITY_DN16578_c0_g1_i1.p1  ORF type:complete len:279 (+),score=34.81 TRINITY_DN16578_c0_g1_i1:314-1150(+)